MKLLKWFRGTYRNDLLNSETYFNEGKLFSKSFLGISSKSFSLSILT